MVDNNEKSPELRDKKIKISDKDKAGKSNKKTGYPKKKSKNRVWSFLIKKVSRRSAFYIIGLAFILALAVIGSNLYFSIFGNQFDNYFSFPEYEGPVLDTPSPLTGVLTTKSNASKKVVGVMVENHPAARPQSGLSKASLVYEALVEGGITRFLAFFDSVDAKKIGPVRSARSYYLPWVKELNSFYAHVGGSDEALELIDSYGILDLDQFFNSSFFWRDSSRYSPHNVYTTSKDLRQAGEERGYPSDNDLESWTFLDEQVSGGSTKSVVVNFSGSDYRVSYEYLAKQNRYKRSMAGLAHRDLEGFQIKPTNLVAQVVNQGLSSDGIHMNVEIIGSGEAYVFTGGKVIKGSWRKDDLNSRTKYFDSSGDEVEFNRGSTWVHLVSSQANLSYK
jgi:hypothetical protein